VRVLPDRQAGRPCGGPDGGPVQAEEGPQVAAAADGHAGQRPGAGAASQAEQHRLGLVVEGVPEKDGRCAEPLGGLVKGPVARVARGCLRPTGGVDRDGDDLDRVEPEPAQRLGDGCRPLGRPGLQAVVDRDRSGRPTGPRRLERQRRRQRDRVRPAAAGNQHRPAPAAQLGEHAADGQPDGGDFGWRPHLAQPRR
jgi:hypothetical protein